jgi:hypothetical protein
MAKMTSTFCTVVRSSPQQEPYRSEEKRAETVTPRPVSVQRCELRLALLFVLLKPREENVIDGYVDFRNP